MSVVQRVPSLAAGHRVPGARQEAVFGQHNRQPASMSGLEDPLNRPV